MSVPSKGNECEPPADKQLETQQRQVIPGAASDSLHPNRNSIVSSEQPESTRRIRRVARACDECRGRKIKCDGRHPCLHCTFLNIECTYDQSNKRPARLSRKEIESKLQRAQNLLKAISPDLDLDNPNLDASTLSQFRIPITEGLSSVQASGGALGATLQSSHQSVIEHDVPLETVLEAAGQLDLDEQGNWSYHGHGSSPAFIRRIGERFGNVSDPGLGKNTVLRLRSMPQIYDSPRNSEDRQVEGSMQDSVSLPPRDVALDLASSALNEACAILRFVHHPSFYSMFERLYLVDPEEYGYEENKFLPLLYAVFAVGYLFSNSERAYFGYAHAISEGEKYFVASRQMLAITECRDLWSLQALVFMIIFLQSSAKMSTCHSYVSAAIAASLQMGLHRCGLEAFNPIERETRKRIFWTIRTMETYVVAILGLPRTVSDDDIDQEMPVEIEDQYITKEGILPMPDGQVSTITGSNAHTKLVQILGKIITNVYPTKRMQKEATEKPRAYVVSDAKVREVESDLQLWAKSLPMQFRPGADSPQELLRAQHLLRLAFTHVQMVLYRPFLHYISCSKLETPTSGQCYAYAAACVDVGRNIIHNAREMEKQDTLNGPYWFSIYTTFCATLSLVFNVWENADIQGTLQTLKDAEYGRDVLVKLAYKSIAAARHSETLAIIFARLPDRLGKSRWKQSKTQRKRHTSSPKQIEPRGSHSDQDIVEIRHNSYEYLQQTNSSADSQASTQATDAVDSAESPSLEAPLNPQYFQNTPETSLSGDFARFLGPNSIEDLFGLQPEHSRDVVYPNLGSTAINPFQNPESLDQYVSILDLQKEGERHRDSNNSGNSTNSLQWGRLGNATTDNTRIRPFIPLSPYLTQMHPPSGNSSIPPKPYAFFVDDYYMVDQNDISQEAWLQGMADDQEIISAGTQNRT